MMSNPAFTHAMLALLFAHLLADFPLQPRRWVTDKLARAWAAPALYRHAALAGVLAWLCAQQWRAWWVAGIVALGHVLFDGWKARRRADGLIAFLGDQTAHAAIIVALAGLLAREGPVRIAPGPALWAIGNALLLVWWFEGVLIDKATARWRESISPPADQERGLPGAGLWIGRLERALILVFVLLGRFDGIGFLIAAKSVFRFGEVTNPAHRREAEYILVGTLGSFLLAILTGLGARVFL